MSNRKALVIVAALFIAAAAILLVIVPGFQGSEVPAKPLQARVSTSPSPDITVSPPVSPVSTPTATAAPTLTPTLSPLTATPAPTATALSSAAVPTQGNLPAITQRTPNLPAGVGLSDAARSCPDPLPLEKIRNDYLEYWKAIQRAHREVNAELLKPYVDQQAQDGKVWQNEQNFIDELQKANAYIEYQIVHSDPLAVAVYPYSAKDCFVKVYDAPEVSAFARKKGTDEPFNAKQPVINQFQPGHSYLMVIRNGRWVMAGEGGKD
ncbi:MAG TPA: hypothetical protein VH186_29725 [Chloroflexia bacterium]|nr:hypothetical protein [Chloroflexia bacterium]